MAEAEAEVKDAPAETEPEAPKADESDAVDAPAEPQQEEQTMRAVILVGHGGYSKLRIEKRPKPKATEGHVVIKVHACGQSFADLMQRQGMLPKFPKAPSSVIGMECSGVVEEVGENVTGFEVGSRVCCLSWTGAFSEFVSVPAEVCFAMPESMSFEDGAAFPVNYLTAYFLLFYCGNLNRRKSVLVHCAAGGVGIAATQLCKTVEGVTVFGTASASKHDIIQKNGVDHAIDYRTEDYVEAVKKITDSVDLVLDPLGGADTKKCYDLLSPLGALVIYGYASNISESKGLFAGLKSWFAGLTFNPLKLISDNKTVCGLAVEDIKPELLREAMDVLMKMYEDGALKPHIDSVFALEEVAQAHQKMHDRANIGKILLSPLKEPDPDAEPVKKKRKKSFSKFHTEKPKIDKDKAAEEEKANGDAEEITEKQAETAAEGEQKESNEATPAETKEEQKEDKPQEEAKEESKEEKKEEVKDQTEETKEEKKEEVKDQTEETKEEKKEEAKEQAQEVKEEAKEEAKEETKQEMKEEPKTETNEAKEDTKEETKEEAKEEIKEEKKEEAKEEVKEEAKEEVKEEPKQESKEEDSEAPKDEKKEDEQQEAKEELKETADQQPAEAEQQQSETKEENGEQNTEM